MTQYSIDDFLQLYLTTVTSNKCVLFLGPGFGETSEGKTVSQSIREKLKTSPLNRPEGELMNNLDEDFDNLFILKSPDGKERALKNLLSQFLNSLEPGDVYKTIARLPFRAFISCTPDLMLYKAFDELNLPCDFHYYSAEGQEEKTVNEKVPVLYNLFGTPENPESLIVTYEDFFKFVVSLLGHGNNQLPTALRYIFTEAEIFMLLGFDLDKWYVPLIVRKLNQGKSTFSSKQLSVLTKDTVYKNEFDSKFSTTFIVLESDTAPVLTALQKAVTDQEKKQGPAKEKPKVDVARLNSILAEVQLKLGDNKVRDAAQLLWENAELIGLKDETKNDLFVKIGQLNDAETQQSNSAIDISVLLGIKATISQYLLNNIVPLLQAKLRSAEG